MIFQKTRDVYLTVSKFCSFVKHSTRCSKMTASSILPWSVRGVAAKWMHRALTAGARIFDDDVEIDLRTKSRLWMSLVFSMEMVEKILGAIRRRNLLETALRQRRSRRGRHSNIKNKISKGREKIGNGVCIAMIDVLIDYAALQCTMI